MMSLHKWKADNYVSHVTSTLLLVSCVLMVQCGESEGSLNRDRTIKHPVSYSDFTTMMKYEAMGLHNIHRSAAAAQRILFLGKKFVVPSLKRGILRSSPSQEFHISITNTKKKNHAAKLNKNVECGTISEEFDDPFAITNRIVGGIEAKLGMWPWIALLGYKVDNNEHRVKFKCGGTLVTDKHVVTAAHCIKDKPELFSVRLGDLDLNSEHDGATPQDVKIVKRVAHEKYDLDTFENDIGIVTLEFRITFTDFIRPICLPVGLDKNGGDFTDPTPLIAGWGATSFGGEASSKLLELGVPILPLKTCREAYEDFGTLIDNRTICAGYTKGGRDACQGDSGGPMVWRKVNTYYLFGVVSYGYNCAEVGYPGIYTKVTEFLNWIKIQTNGKPQYRMLRL